MVVKNEEIKNRFIIWLLDKRLSEHLKFTPKLKLDKALDMVKSYEQIRTQIEEREAKNVNKVWTKGIAILFSQQNWTLVMLYSELLISVI